MRKLLSILWLFSAHIPIKIVYIRPQMIWLYEYFAVDNDIQVIKDQLIFWSLTEQFKELHAFKFGLLLSSVAL